MKRATLWLSAVVMAVVLIVGVAACGSSSDSSSSAETASTETTEAAGGGGSAAAEEAAAIVEPLTKRPTSIGITAPVEKPVPTGKKIDFISCGAAACDALGKYVKQAAAAVGWSATVIDAPYQTPEDIKNVWEKVITDEVDALIASGGTPRQTYQPQLTKLVAEKVPVIEIGTGEPEGDGVTLISDGQPSYERRGERLAQWVIAQSNGEGSAAVMDPTGVTSSELQVETFIKTMEETCSTCEPNKFEVPITSLGNDLASRTASYLTANPGNEFLVPAWGDLAEGVPAALSGAGISDVSIVTQALSPESAQYLKKGDVFEAVYGYPSAEISFKSVDALIRYFNGESLAPDKEENLPEWILTEENLPPEYAEGYFPLVKDYQAQYEKLWGI